MSHLTNNRGTFFNIKKIASLCAFLIVLFFIHQSVSATGQVYTYTGDIPVSITSTSTTTARVVIDLPAASSSTYKAYICVTDTAPSITCGKVSSSGSIYNENVPVATKIQRDTFNLNNLDPTKNYFVAVVTENKKGSYQFFTGDTSLTDAPTVTSQKSGDNVAVTAKIDIKKHPDYATYTAGLVFSKNNDLSSPINGGSLTGEPAPASTTGGPSTDSSDAGTFYWTLTHLDPSTQYYYQVTVTSGSGQKVTSTINYFNSSQGVTIAPGSAAQQADLNTRSYTLLSKGFPGLTVLPDPDLCAQEKAAGNAPQVCDLNDLLNYALKLMIGISGVVLVLRLMFEGYQIMVSDVPFLKAKAKGGFLTALGGLVLALSSYIILNTINPKLVSEDVNVAQLSIGVDQTSIDSTTFQQQTGESLKTKSQYIPIVQSISQQQGIDACVVEATIQVESDWNAADIGCDENSPYSNVPSRRAYVQSGINYDGSTFTPSSDTSISQRNNACTFDAKKPGFGLDWRFSKGGGLMQVTIAPTGYKSAAWYAGVKSGGSYWNTRTTPYAGWQNLVTPEVNIAKGIAVLKEGLAACNGSVEEAFRYYQSGSSCTAGGTLIDATVAKKLSVYTSCKNGQQT